MRLTLALVLLAPLASAQPSAPPLADHVAALRAIDTFTTDHDSTALVRLASARAVVADSLDRDVAEVNALVAQLETVAIDRADEIARLNAEVDRATAEAAQEREGRLVAEALAAERGARLDAIADQVADWKNRLARLLAPLLAD